MILEGRGDGAREIVAIDGERGTRGHPRAIGSRNHDRAKPAHLFFQDADGGLHRIVAERIRAYELRKICRPMSFGHFDRPHLDQPHGNPPARELVGSLAAREPRSDNGYIAFTHRELPREHEPGCGEPRSWWFSD